MKKHVKKKWLKALRSGEYKQGRSQLVDDNDNFCCLGVLCNLAPQSTGKWAKKQQNWGFIDKNNQYEHGLLTPSVEKWAGLNTNDPLVLYEVIKGLNKYYVRLSKLNDDFGLTFEEIADAIEESL